jgi:prepilin-type N-terminal cleavage/methylation domain-containing protein
MPNLKIGVNLGSHRGFTTIELVVVITVVGILAVVAISRGLNAPVMNAREAAAMVGTDIRRTQELAMAQVVSYRITFNGTSSYQIIQDPGGGNTVVKTETIPAGITASAATIDFNSLGEPSGGATITVGSSSVTVAQYTGRVDYI